MSIENIENINSTQEVMHDPDLEDLNEHNYDGIEELDNPPPAWIMFILYFTIGIALLYGAYYFWVGNGLGQIAEYERSVEQAALKQQSEMPAIEMILLTDEASLAEGRQIFQEMNCAACHGTQGEGNAIGPNLTDEYWINGCTIEDVFDQVKNGNPLKGMTPFKGLLTDDRIMKVASYVLVTMQTYEPENPKEPQGEKCE